MSILGKLVVALGSDTRNIFKTSGVIEIKLASHSIFEVLDMLMIP
jgi:hypothetical protein